MIDQPKDHYTDGPGRMDLLKMRDRLKEMSASEISREWKSLAEFSAGQPVESPVPGRTGVDRRDFMKLMGASMALAGAAGCTRQPTEKIIPYVDAPEEIIPGKPLFFSTAMVMGGVATGLLAESHMGRPTKLEGNPEHPGSLGSTDSFMQASILDLYDPDRSQSVMRKGRPSAWSAFTTDMTGVLEKAAENEGRTLKLLLEPTSSPTLLAQLNEFKELYPKAGVHFFSPVDYDAACEGAELAFGRKADVLYHFDRAKIIVSLDSDFMTVAPARVRYMRDFAASRDLRDGQKDMSRFYALESDMTVTGAAADHRLAVKSSRIEMLVRALAHDIGLDIQAHGNLTDAEKTFIHVVTEDLKHHEGAAVVVPGDHQPPAVHALAHAINEKLGGFGKTVSFIDPVVPVDVHTNESFRILVEDMKEGKVDTLVMLGVNPVYCAPSNMDFKGAIQMVDTLVHLGSHFDETGVLSHWHIPQAHTLETWSDARAFDGTATIIQPLIAPLYAGKSAHDLMAVLDSKVDIPGYDIVREVWKEMNPVGFEPFWRTALHDGVVKGSAFTPVEVKVDPAFLNEMPARMEKAESLEVVFRPDSGTWDGRFSNNAWLQERPRPVTTLTWDNVITMSPKTAKELGCLDPEFPARESLTPENKIIELHLHDQTISGPALAVPGHADGVLTLSLGYGRTQAGRVGSGIGYNAYTVRNSSWRWIDIGVTVESTGERYPLALTQDHHSMAGRAIARSGTLAQYKKDHEFVQHMAHNFPDNWTMYPPFDYSKGNQWGMTIDLNTCVGCNACVVACQSENIIPTVGKKEVMNGREMHWIRVDRYYEGDPMSGDVQVKHQPMACVQCEAAPCETVCPVGATMHSNDGLNQMVYNRCVGTRYCSNNCPYKVRRFNYFQYVDLKTESLKLGRNPNVTPRARGVMEKCTYCVQRINAARIEAKKDNRPLVESDITTACQQACPTRAITFGDINDPQSKVSRYREQDLAYEVLGELNTRPRTSHLAKIRNPNPALEAPAPQGEDGHGGSGGHH